MLAYEARHRRPGSETLIARLIDIILVQAVRVWVEDQPHDQGAWLGALRDPQIGVAIGLIHREPQRNWSVSALAREVGMSRSIFASKFSSLVGGAAAHLPDALEAVAGVEAARGRGTLGRRGGASRRL